MKFQVEIRDRSYMPLEFLRMMAIEPIKIGADFATLFNLFRFEGQWSHRRHGISGLGISEIGFGEAGRSAIPICELPIMSVQRR